MTMLKISHESNYLVINMIFLSYNLFFLSKFDCFLMRHLRQFHSRRNNGDLYTNANKLETAMTSQQAKWALVTGASSGIGEAFAERLAADGFNVFISARRDDRLTEIKNRLEQTHGIQVYKIVADLSDRAAVTTIIETVQAAGVEISFLVNNAGYGTNGRFHEIAVERELTMIDVNCRSLVELSGHFSRQMVGSGSGTIVHTASVGGFGPIPYFATYGATKAFVLSFSEALAEELEPHGVKVMTLCPGATQTEFIEVSKYRGSVPSQALIQSASDVVGEAFVALRRRKSLVVTGRSNRIIVAVMSLLPRLWSRRINGRVMRPLVGSPVPVG